MEDSENWGDTCPPGSVTYDCNNLQKHFEIYVQKVRVHTHECMHTHITFKLTVLYNLWHLVFRW